MLHYCGKVSLNLIYIFSTESYFIRDTPCNSEKSTHRKLCYEKQLDELYKTISNYLRKFKARQGPEKQKEYKF